MPEMERTQLLWLPVYIFFRRVREKQLRESYVLKYGDKVKGMNQIKSSSDKSLMDIGDIYSKPCRDDCFSLQNLQIPRTCLLKPFVSTVHETWCRD